MNTIEIFRDQRFVSDRELGQLIISLPRIIKTVFKTERVIASIRPPRTTDESRMLSISVKIVTDEEEADFKVLAGEADTMIRHNLGGLPLILQGALEVDITRVREDDGHRVVDDTTSSGLSRLTCTICSTRGLSDSTLVFQPHMSLLKREIAKQNFHRLHPDT